MNPRTGVTYREHYEWTLQRNEQIRRAGFTLIHCWECDVKREMAADPDMKEFMDKVEVRARGGGTRTTVKYRLFLDSSRVLHSRAEGRNGWERSPKRQKTLNSGSHTLALLQQIYFFRYLDFSSMYSSVMASCHGEEYPVGIPDVRRGRFTEEECRTFPFKGIALMKIIPPRRLLHPVLGNRVGEHLCFSLCKICATDRLHNCPHTDEERALTG